jgi:hypothetical protein
MGSLKKEKEKKNYIKQLLWKFFFPFKCFHIYRLCSYDLIKLSYQEEINASERSGEAL